MKTKDCLFLLFALLWSSNSFAYDIAVKNADSIMIYYNYINDGKELEVTYWGLNYSSYSGNVVIPENVTFMNRTRKVSSIGESAFYKCKNLTSVTIPRSVNFIGSGAFMYCDALISVHISDLEAWCNIRFGQPYNSFADTNGFRLFLNDEEIIDLIIPNGISSIENGIFQFCISINTVTIHNRVTSIGDHAFYECKSLTSINIPNSVINIGNSTFARCGLTSINIPNSVTEIGEYTFCYCRDLTSITISNSVTRIGGCAFYRCSKLTSVTIPNSVTYIGGGAFADSDITTVISHIENPFEIRGKNGIYLGVFSQNTFNNATLYVPRGSIDKYKITEGWKDFVFIEEISNETSMASMISNNQTNEIYSLNGNKQKAPSKGINIIKMNDGTTRKVIIK